LATKCPDCAGSTDTFHMTVNDLTHRDQICAYAAVNGRNTTDGLSKCARCGAVGHHDNGHCDACDWWAR
jgi:hypothetical protein